MYLATPDMIKHIDAFSASVLGLSERTLMGRSGRAVSDAIRSVAPTGARVVYLLGKGNNGGDGYASALLLSDYRVTVADVFSAGQRTDGGRFYLEEYKRSGGSVIGAEDALRLLCDLDPCDVIVDGIFGTGFFGEPPPAVISLVEAANASSAHRIAIDIPLGINAADGSVSTTVFKAEKTVSLSYHKAGLLSYPAADCVGEIILDELGIDRRAVEERFEFRYSLTDEEFARAALPKRAKNSNKGSFGKLLLITGSDEYRGAAHLALEAALRGGVGLAHQACSSELCAELRMKLPEAIYHSLPADSAETHNELCALSDVCAATVVGSGSGVSRELLLLTEALIARHGSPILLDADALNSIARYSSAELLRSARRAVVLTPHPLEFSRLSGLPVEYIQSHRIECAENFAKEFGVILLLKGASTVITDGRYTYINGSGSSALAKGGSGDVLAGLCGALLATSSDSLRVTALAAYLHGSAGDRLSERLSDYGVTPSDLPRAVCEIICGLIKNKENKNGQE